MSIRENEKPYWEAVCDTCGNHDEEPETGGWPVYVTREEALTRVRDDLEWVEREGLLFCASCIENVDYPSEDVDAAVALLLARVRDEAAEA